MGRFDVNAGLDDLMSSLNALDVELIAPAALKRAAPLVESRLRTESERHKRTGEMAKSIKARAPDRDKNGNHYVFIGPSGTDSRGVRNMEKMAYLEYGVRAHKQAPTPVITPVVRSAERGVCETMQQVFNEYLDRLKL